ncbi:hypothetical protein ACFYZ8_34515 [Streptomyces sp. NPDC001668]|uniref:hypothetical protein n=1 Tax=Streptomyces sp. NPDC001668 TaxID=3364598 RepID=UPI0036B3A876
MSASPAGTVELALLRGWLRGIKGAFTYDTLVRRAGEHGQHVCERTLRRAVRQTLDGRLPSLRVVVAFAHGAVHAQAHAASASRGADPLEVQRAEQTGRALWEAAASAVRRRTQPRPRRVTWVPGHITTQAGLTRAMQRLREEAGNPSLRELAAAPQTAGRLSASALHLALTGKRLPSERLLTAFTAACHASEAALQALLSARRRITNPPQEDDFTGVGYPCEIIDLVEETEEPARPWLAPEPELDWYDQQLRDEEQAATDSMIAWIDSLTAEEIEDLQRQAEAGDGRDLRAELTALISRAEAAR